MQSIQSIEINHFFENRIYISPSPLSKKELNEAIVQDNVEQKGAGVRCYGSFVGKILAMFGYACKIDINGKDVYFNIKSFSNFIIRDTELKGFSSIKNSAKKLNDLYIKHLKEGYDENKVKRVSAELVQILKECGSKEGVSVDKLTKYLPDIKQRLMLVAAKA